MVAPSGKRLHLSLRSAGAGGTYVVHDAGGGVVDGVESSGLLLHTSHPPQWLSKKRMVRSHVYELHQEEHGGGAVIDDVDVHTSHPPQ